MQRSHFLSLAFSRVTLEGLRKKRGVLVVFCLPWWSLCRLFPGPCDLPALFMSKKKFWADAVACKKHESRVESAQKTKESFSFFLFFFGWLVISPSLCTTYTLYGTSIWQYKKPCKWRGMSTKTIYVQIDPFRFTFVLPYSNSGEGHFYTK